MISMPSGATMRLRRWECIGTRTTRFALRFEGDARTRISGRGGVLLPGSVNVYSHPTSEALRRGITDEIRRASTTARSTSSCRCSRATTRRVRPASGSRSRSCSGAGGPPWLTSRYPTTDGSTRSPRAASAPAPRPCTAMRVGSPGTATALNTNGTRGVAARRSEPGPLPEVGRPAGHHGILNLSHQRSALRVERRRNQSENTRRRRTSAPASVSDRRGQHDHVEGQRPNPPGRR